MENHYTTASTSNAARTVKFDLSKLSGAEIDKLTDKLAAKKVKFFLAGQTLSVNAAFEEEAAFEVSRYIKAGDEGELLYAPPSKSDAISRTFDLSRIPDYEVERLKSILFAAGVNFTILDTTLLVPQKSGDFVAKEIDNLEHKPSKTDKKHLLEDQITFESLTNPHRKPAKKYYSFSRLIAVVIIGAAASFATSVISEEPLMSVPTITLTAFFALFVYRFR